MGVVTLLTVLSSYPKSGNTWLRAFIESLRRDGGAVDINANMARICPAADRHMFDCRLGIKSAQLSLGEVIAARPDVWRRVVEAASDPPWIKTHDALLPPCIGAPPMFPRDVIGAAIYIVRDPRDVAISFAHHFDIDVDSAIDCLADAGLFLDLPRDPPADQLPQFVSSWSDHVDSWLDARDVKLHVVRYEDMHARPEETFAGVAGFLGFSATSDVVQRAIAASRFDVLRGQEERDGFTESDLTTAKFFRQGRVGGWRNILSSAQAARIERRHTATMQRLGYAA